MMWVRRGVLVVLGLIALSFVGFNLFKKQIATGLFERVTDRRVGVDFAGQLPDGLHVYMCGTGSPMPDTSRAGPCLGVLAGDRAYVFDIGSGGGRNLGSMNFPFDRLQHVYLTHLHSDHLDGLGELLVLSWVGGGRSEPTPISGPTGTQRVVDGFNMAYSLDSTYRVAHHGPAVANPDGFGGIAREIVLPAGPGGKAVVFEDEVLTITAIRVSHAPIEPAFGYRIDYKDRSVAISGDTIYHPAFNAAAEGVDVMLHEALDPEMASVIGGILAERGQANTAKIFTDVQDYHATPEDTAQSAQDAQAEALVLYHIAPPVPVKLMETMFLGDAKSQYDGPITVGIDGLMISLPADSDQISTQRLF